MPIDQQKKCITQNATEKEGLRIQDMKEKGCSALPPFIGKSR